MKQISVIVLGLWVCFALPYFSGCELICALSTPATESTDSASLNSEMDHSRHSGHHAASGQPCPTSGNESHQQRCLTVFHPAQSVQVPAMTGQNLTVALALPMITGSIPAFDAELSDHSPPGFPRSSRTSFTFTLRV